MLASSPGIHSEDEEVKAKEEARRGMKIKTTPRGTCKAVERESRAEKPSLVGNNTKDGVSWNEIALWTD